MKKKLLALGVVSSLVAVRPGVGRLPGQAVEPSGLVPRRSPFQRLSPAERVIERARARRQVEEG